jgi:hypothetical protein
MAHLGVVEASDGGRGTNTALACRPSKLLGGRALHGQAGDVMVLPVDRRSSSISFMNGDATSDSRKVRNVAYLPKCSCCRE